MISRSVSDIDQEFLHERPLSKSKLYRMADYFYTLFCNL